MYGTNGTSPGISRPGPVEGLGLEYRREFPGRETGGTGWAGRTPYFWYPGDVPGEGPKVVGNPPGRQGPEITKNRNLLKNLLIITFSILARFG